MQAAYRAFATEVADTEWSAQSRTETRPGEPDLLNEIHSYYAQVEPADDLHARELVAARANLHDLEVARQERQMTVEARLASVFWLVMGLGAVITMTFVFFFRFQSRAVHAALTGLLAAAIVAVLSLVYTLDGPYTGHMQVSKHPIESALLQFDAIDLPPP